MTGCTCPVHGEYSETGVCRWCEEPEAIMLPPDGVRFLVPAEAPLTSDELTAWYDWTRVDAVELLDGLPPIAVCPDNVTAAMNELWLRLSTRGGATAFFPHTLVLADESRLASEHAALRWERVARRWNRKHGGAGGDEEGRAYVWRWWLEQMDRQSAGLPLAGPFPLGFYAW